ncbi:unnamed protein product [Thelazia callipaeda]|uniref:CASP-like protein n=1 Tax=Thelazia callipaeda TaxID=103827 RepID=A0A0N5D7V9_THECL|nr:unnamed protein product [Thelazia callipaeda]
MVTSKNERHCSKHIPYVTVHSLQFALILCCHYAFLYAPIISAIQANVCLNLRGMLLAAAMAGLHWIGVLHNTHRQTAVCRDFLVSDCCWSLLIPLLHPD